MEFCVRWEWMSRPLQAYIFNSYGAAICTIYNNGKALAMIVDNVIIQEEYRNQGMGTKLMEKILDFANENSIDSVELVVNEENKIAQRLYDKIGFEKTEKIHMRKILRKWKT